MKMNLGVKVDEDLYEAFLRKSREIKKNKKKFNMAELIRIFIEQFVLDEIVFNIDCLKFEEKKGDDEGDEENQI